MREIKFRAWDSVDKKMHTNRITGDKGIISVFGRPHSVLMQSTGLKDSNNIEIYEGDVLKGTATLGVVKYNENDCAFQIYEPDGICFLNGENVFSLTLCVVGNIYENPKLLE